MLAYLVRRTAYGFATVLGVLALLFALFFLYAAPVDMARRALGEKAPPEVVDPGPRVSCRTAFGHQPERSRGARPLGV